MSTFPAVNDSNATLYVANDNIQTTLSVVQNPSDTVAIVASTVGWSPYMIATIDNEQEMVTAVVGANTLQVTRNFNGTGSASHAAGRKVSNFVDAAYHSAVSSAIQAIQQSLTGGPGGAWPHGPQYKTPNNKYKWSFNDPDFGLALFTQYGVLGGPYITASNPGGGDGQGEAHYYYHDAGNAAVAAIGKSWGLQAYKHAGSGGTLSGVWVDVTADGTWTAQAPAGGGITNGPIAGTFSATLNHSTGPGGFALSLNTYATCNGPSPAQQLSGIEVDIANHVVGTSGHVGIMVVDQSTQPTTQAGADFGYGLIGQGGSPGFQDGIHFYAGGVASNGTVFRAAGACQNGIDLSACTFGGYALFLPGFTLGPTGNILSPLTINTGGAAETPLTLQSSAKTSGNMLSMVHTTTTWTGNGLSMSFGLGGGTYSGDFIACFIAGALKFEVTNSGGLNSGPQNYIGTETGANNAIVATVPVALAAGLRVSIKLAHSLQVGVNTLNGAPIKSSRNPANNIATGYAVGGIFTAIYDGANYLDVSQ